MHNTAILNTITEFYVCISDLDRPPQWQTDPVPGQAEVYPDCAGDILDWEEAEASVCWNSTGSERLSVSSAAGSGDPLCFAFCPSASSLHPAYLSGGVPQATAQLAWACRHLLSLPGFHLLPADEQKSGFCSEDSLCKRVTG